MHIEQKCSKKKKEYNYLQNVVKEKINYFAK